MKVGLELGSESGQGRIRVRVRVRVSDSVRVRARTTVRVMVGLESNQMSKIINVELDLLYIMR